MRSYNVGAVYGVKIFLFGRFSVERDGQVLSPHVWKNTKTKSLLKILASERGRVFSADELIEYLWPDAELDLRSAASNLRNRIAELRKILEPSLSRGEQSRYILTQRGGYLLSDESDCWVDIEEFSQCEGCGRRAHSEGNFVEAIRAFEQALALYRGEYLAEDRYEEWALQIRERFRECFVEILSLLADSLARQGQYRAALSYLERAVAESPLDEKLYRQMMVYAFCAGERARARQTYERCRAVLERELGERPSSQTEEIYRQIQSERVPDWERFYPRAVSEGVTLPVTIRRPPFVGRTREWEQLLAALGRVRAGAGHVVLIFGEAGVGKTRLGEEFARWAHEHEGALALCGRCYELENSMPLHLWVEVLRQGISHVHRADLAGVPSAWLAELSELLPELARVIPGLSPVALPPEHRQYRLFETLYRIISSLALRHAPLLVFLDDLQWADSSSLDFLCYLIERIASEPVLILGAARLEELSPGVERVRHHGVRLGRLSEMTLPRLGEREISQLVQSLAGDIETTADFGGRLYRASLGNPLFATAVLHTLFENGAFVAEGARWRLSDPSRIELAPSAVQLLERRVKRASAAAQRVLQIVACAVQIELEISEAIWDGSPEELFAHLAELVSQGLVVEREGRYECAHDTLREVVYESLEGPRRVWLHRRLAQAIERVYADPVAAGLAGQLAEHYERGGQLVQALEWAIRGIEYCQRQYRNEEGLLLAARGLKLLGALRGRLPVPKQREKEFELVKKQIELEIRIGKGAEVEDKLHTLFSLASQDQRLKAQAYTLKALYKACCGEYLEELEAARKAYALYKEINDRRALGESLYEIGIAYFYLGKYKQALGYFERAHGIFEEFGDKSWQASALGNIGCAHIALGDPSGITYQLRALELVRENRDLGEENKLLNNIAIMYGLVGNYQKARDFFEQSLTTAQQIGDRFGMGMALLNLGEIFRLIGLPQKALDYWDRAQAIFTELQSHASLVKILWRLGCAYRDLGNYERACSYFQEALGRYMELEDPVSKAICCSEYARTCIAMGRFEDAEEHLHQALSLIQGLDMAELAAECWSALGEIRLKQGRLPEALEASEKALKFLHEYSLYRSTLIGALWRHYLILENFNRHEEARAFLQQARAQLLEVAYTFTDDSLRQSFLEIPLHRQILAAVDSLP